MGPAGEGGRGEPKPKQLVRELKLEDVRPAANRSCKVLNTKLLGTLVQISRLCFLGLPKYIIDTVCT